MNASLAYRLGDVGFFLLNCYTYLNGSLVNSFFNSRAPTLEEYIPLEETLELYE